MYKNRIINFQQKYPLRGIENICRLPNVVQKETCVAIFNCIRLKHNLRIRIKTCQLVNKEQDRVTSFHTEKYKFLRKY